MSDERPTSKNLKPLTWMLHKSGSVVRLSHRKEDGSGWWLCDNRGGLSDQVINESRDWRPHLGWQS